MAGFLPGCGESSSGSERSSGRLSPWLILPSCQFLNREKSYEISPLSGQLSPLSKDLKIFPDPYPIPYKVSFF